MARRGRRRDTARRNPPRPVRVEYVGSMRLRAFSVSVLLASAVMASGLTPAASSAAETPYLNEIAAHLRARAPGTENRIWWFSHGNHLPAGWLLNTPDCWGAQQCGTPPRGGQKFVDTLATMLAGARSSVDISDLYPPPDGPFRDAIVKGLREAIHRGHHLTVRVLVGTYPSSFAVSFFSGGIVHAETYANDLVGALSGSGPTPTIDVAYPETERFGIGALSFATSWNHEKVIDVDGRSAIVGGMNPWTKDYLTPPNPVDDVSMHVTGPAAAEVMRYDNVLWGWACSHASESTLVTRNGGCAATRTRQRRPPGESRSWSSGISATGSACPAPRTGSHPRSLECRCPGTGARSCGRRPRATTTAPTSSAIPARTRSARWWAAPGTRSSSHSRTYSPAYRSESLRPSRNLMTACSRLSAGKSPPHVPIRIVVSPKANADYSNGYTMTDVAEVLKTVVSKEEHVSGARARERLCQDVGLATIRDRTAGGWPGGQPFRNHANSSPSTTVRSTSARRTSTPPGCRSSD